MEDSSGPDDIMSVLAAELDKRLTEAFLQELLGLDENNQPRAGGFTGIRGIFDEVPEFDFWSQRPKQFTPSEFNKMWDSYTEDQKIQYILTLIT